MGRILLILMLTAAPASAEPFAGTVGTITANVQAASTLSQDAAGNVTSSDNPETVSYYCTTDLNGTVCYY